MSAPLRIEFARGERLRARDLTDAFAQEQRRRELHVTAVHGVRGIALGFDVHVGGDGRFVTVGPGFAYDRRGREVVSSETACVPAPARDGMFDLAFAHPRCVPEWLWLEPGKACDEVVLARFFVKGGQLGEPDLSVRRHARGASARIAGGTYTGPVADPITVDTGAGGFRTTPFYFATVGDLAEGTLHASVAIANPTETSFDLELRVFYATVPTPSIQGLVTVSWLGVEPPPRCGLPPSLESLLSDPINPD